MSRSQFMACLCLMMAACGSGDGPGPIGSSCQVDDDCALVLCLNAFCADPAADIDYDGLPTGVELAAGLDPLHPDSDGDGLPDGFESGNDPDRLLDGDGDGLIDALESASLDADLDCLPDQYDDSRNELPATGAELVPVVCSGLGVCGVFSSLVTASCSAGKPVCDYSAIPYWNRNEWLCDGFDNNCDGRVDDGFYYDGIAVGKPCEGVGECGAGLVECEPNGFVTRCSSNPGGSDSAVTDEICDGLDNDCDGQSDDGLVWNAIALGKSCDGTGDCGVGVVECMSDGTAGCSTLAGGSREQVVDEYCDARDNDCDGETDEEFSGDPTRLCVFRGVCSQNPNYIGVACDDGVLECDFTGVPGYSGSSELLCDGTDDDCDGQVDEEPEFGIHEPGIGTRYPGQTCGLGECSGGVVRCSMDGGSGVCSTSGLASAESCNDLDDDCDGQVDDGMFKYWTVPPVTVVDAEPQSRLGSMVAVADESDVDAESAGSLQAGVYVCGGAGTLSAGVPSGFTGSCWYWSFETRRFTRIPTGPVVESGAMVFDPDARRLVIAGVSPGGTIVRFWELRDLASGWTGLETTLDGGTVLGAGIEGAGSRLFVLVQAESGLELSYITPDSPEPVSVTVASTVEPGSFAAFDPSGGFYVWHACDSERNTYLEFVSFSGGFRLDPLEEPETCMSYGAAVVVDSGTMLVMSGQDRRGVTNGTARFVNRGSIWRREVLSGAGTLGSVARPGMAASSSVAWAFSGVSSDGRGLRRMLTLGPEDPSWVVASVVSGPSPRAGGVAFSCSSAASAFFLGGWGDEPGGSALVGDFWRLNLVTGLFVQMSQPDAGQYIRSAAAVNDETSEVFVFGGLDDVPGDKATPVATFFRFNCVSGRWESLQSGPPARYGHSMIWTGDRLLLYGGLNNDGFLGDLWSWTAAGGWVKEGDYGLRFGHVAFWDAVGGRMLVAGGRPGGDLSSWDPVTKEWQVLQSANVLDSADGHGWFDPESRTLLYLASTSAEAAIFRFVDQSFDYATVSGLQTGILSGYAVYDKFGRRGLMFGGVDPETGTIASVTQMTQACPN